MPVRNTNDLFKLILLAIPLASASLVDPPASNSTVGVTVGPIRANGSSITSPNTSLVSAAPPTDANVVEIGKERLPGTFNSTVNEMALSSGGLPGNDVSIKKGGGAAGSRGGDFFGGSGSSGNGGSGGNSGSDGNGGSDGKGGGGNGGSDGRSDGRGGGNGGSGGRGSSGGNRGSGGRGGAHTIGAAASSASSTSDEEVWFPLGGGLFDAPSWAGTIGGPGIVTLAMALMCVTTLIVCGIL